MQLLSLANNPDRALALYLIGSATIALIASYYESVTCEYGIDGICSSWSLGSLFDALILSPIWWFACVPLFVGAIFVIVRKYRWNFSASFMHKSIKIMTLVSMITIVLIIYGSVATFVIGAPEFQMKQCYPNMPPSQYPPGEYKYCVGATVIFSLTSSLAPALVGAAIATIVFAKAYLENF